MTYEASRVNAFVMLAFTLLLIAFRFRLRPDSNWPLFYYLLLVGLHQTSYGLFNPFAIYLAVVCALFMRFEFMSKGFRSVFRVVELVSLVYIATTLVDAVGF